MIRLGSSEGSQGKMEQLLMAVIVSPFFITMAVFAVAFFFAPALPNEISPETEHDHEEMDHS